jgi:mannose-6-phosphate isomerase
VRGGLTPKHVDVEELLQVLQFEPLVDPVVQPVADGAGRWRYPTPGAPFRVTRLDVATAVAHTARGRELLVCTAGDTGLLGRGEAVFLADGETIGLGGPSTVWVTGEA